MYASLDRALRPRLRTFVHAVAVLSACAGIAAPAAAGTYVVGNRAFPATPLTEDPFVADEVSSTVSHIRFGASGANPATKETEFDFGAARRLTQNLGLSVEGGYAIQQPTGGSNVYGFTNLDVTLKYQFYLNDAHELLLSGGVTREFGGTGALRVGADSVGTTTPTIYFGKGFGDLPDSLAYLKPLAVTGTLGYQLADERGPARPDQLATGLSVQYSLRYLEGNVKYLGLPEFIDRLTPLMEISYTTPATAHPGTTTVGTVAAGVIYSGNRYDLGIEAMIQTAGQPHSNVGVLASLHLRLDRFFSGPLFGAGE